MGMRCDNQQELDEYWSNLSAAAEEFQCGWLKNRFGLCGRSRPQANLVKHPKAMQAMMLMKKLDIAELKRAAHE
jgi:predicted 3-demethylubiquinone-9 3-methyltransferase (glyoxalase superfamily)